MTSLVDQTIEASSDDGFDPDGAWPGDSITQTPHYTPCGGSSASYQTTYRFTLDNDIPHGSTFNAGCDFELWYGGFTTGLVVANLIGEEASSPATFNASTRLATDITARTTERVAWTISSHGGTDSYENCGDVQDVLTEIMDDKGDTDDIDFIVIIVEEDDPTDIHWVAVDSYDTASSNPALLTVEYDAPASGAVATRLALTGVGV